MFFTFLPVFLGAIGEEEFEALFSGYRGRMLAVARSVLHDRQEAEDAVQTAFLAVYRQRARLCFSSDEQKKIYLCKCAKSAALNLLRKREEAVSLPDEDLAAATDGGSAEVFEERARYGDLVAAVRALPPAYRDALTLRYLYDMKVSDVALSLSLPLNTVKSHLKRGRELLRRALEKEGSR